MAFGRRHVADPVADPEVDLAREERAVDRDDLVDTRTGRWDVGSALATAAGVALIVIGTLAMARTGVDRTWFDPVDQVLGYDHTALLGAIEVGAGIVLVLAGLAGARALAGLVAVVVGAAATVVAIEPEVADRELAIQREWATALAVGGFLLALIIVVSRERTHERRVQRRRITRPA